MHYSRSFAVALSVFVSMGVGYVIRHALAEGVPTQDALLFNAWGDTRIYGLVATWTAVAQ